MGTCASSPHIDDSVHRMLKHEAKASKARGQKLASFEPRAHHPLVHQRCDMTTSSTTSSDDNNHSKRAIIIASEDDFSFLTSKQI